MTSAQRSEIRSKIAHLPTLPTVVTKILQLLNNPKAGADDISRYIENDIALSSMVLKLANSAYYGLPQTISSIHTATMVMGFNSIKNLAIPASMAQMFPATEAESSFSWDGFWIHGVETAVFARALVAQYKLQVDKEQIFTTGLLHDVGRLILKQVYPADFELVLSDVQQGMDWTSAEMSRIGLSGAEAGTIIFEGWNFPDNICEPIQHHCNPPGAGKFIKEAWVVHLAHKLSLAKGTRVVEGEPFDIEIGPALTALGIKASLQELLDSMAPELDKAASFLELFQRK